MEASVRRRSNQKSSIGESLSVTPSMVDDDDTEGSIKSVFFLFSARSPDMSVQLPFFSLVFSSSFATGSFTSSESLIVHLPKWIHQRHALLSLYYYLPTSLFQPCLLRNPH
jgi:hypothetical protein